MAKKAQEANQSARSWLEKRPDPESVEKAIEKLGPLFRRRRTKDLHWWHKVGVLASKVVKANDTHHGLTRYLAATLADADSEDNDADRIKRGLYFARQLVTRFPEWSVLKKWSKGLSFTQVKELLREPDGRIRNRLRRQCRSDGLSTRRIALAVRRQRGYKKSHGGRHRRVEQIATPRLAVQELIDAAKRWGEVHEQCFGEKGPLRDVRKKDRDDALLGEIERATKDLGKVCKALIQAQRRLEEI